MVVVATMKISTKWNFIKKAIFSCAATMGTSLSDLRGFIPIIVAAATVIEISSSIPLQPFELQWLVKTFEGLGIE